ncbi:hypothetical protein [Gilvibacter sediminis]|uniref:hypothetical protein n=1 Tax=Gilvibacter sediminis TaxID=379071 RepID=UPI00234FC3AB|nr:hypothetical protein [Gilvibacter sediminis]MDC7999005.1 hypothetical protein [Gilvibacter sediminis]
MKTILTISLLLSAWLSQAQDEYLTIYRSGQSSDQISYPPNTPFELTDETGAVVFSDKSDAKQFEIRSTYELTLYPSYRDKPETYTLTSGKLTLNPAKRLQVTQSDSNWGYTSNGISVTKTLSASKRNYGLQNVTLNFSNGVVFTYMDGDYKATLNGKELEIKGKYLIYSPLGIHKVSFNPQSGKAYWVFEPRS